MAKKEIQNNQDDFRNIIESLLEDQTKEIVRVIEKKLEERQNENKTELFNENKDEVNRREQEIKRLEKEIEEEKRKKKREIEEYEEKLDELRKKCEEQNGEIGYMRKEIRKKEVECIDINDRYEDMKKEYGSVMEAYNSFQSLETSTKERLRNIFVTDSFACFISSCFEWDNIEGIWNYTKRMTIEKPDLDVEKLNVIFHFMFSGYNSRFQTPRYVLISPDVGTKYNSDEQVILGRKTDGILQKVCLVGYKNSNGKVINKALVEV